MLVTVSSVVVTFMLNIGQCLMKCEQLKSSVKRIFMKSFSSRINYNEMLKISSFLFNLNTLYYSLIPFSSSG